MCAYVCVNTHVLEWWCRINVRVYVAHVAFDSLNRREKKNQVIALDLTSCI